MNKINKIAVLSLLAAFIFTSCKREISTIYYKGGTPPVLTVTEVANVEYANADETALILNWTNPNYQFTTGVSSQNVNYTILIDTVGSNFSKAYPISVSENLSYTITVSQMNDIMQNQMNLLPAMAHDLQIKVVAALANGSVPLSSDSVEYTATPYVIPPKVTPPASGTLYIVGSAVAGGWNNPIAESNVNSQQFTQVSPTDYKLTTQIIGDGEYKFVGVNGSWDQQWSVQTEQASGDPSTLSADLYFNGANCRAPLASGTYIIDVDFQKGKITLIKQ
jgi:hypothetical protein